MKHILKCYLPICILLLSCDSRDNVKRQYEQLTSDTISLCLNQMMAVSYDGDDILQVKPKSVIRPQCSKILAIVLFPNRFYFLVGILPVFVT